jgi:hypothetical protein
MLVSDIDGTMIGEHGDPQQYASSKRFRWVTARGVGVWGGPRLLFQVGVIVTQQYAVQEVRWVRRRGGVGWAVVSGQVR